MQTQSALGWNGPDKIDVRVTNRLGASVAVGDVVILDNGRNDADSTTNQTGVSTGGVGNIVAVTTALQPYGMYGVVQRAAVDNGTTVVRLKGFCDFVNVSATVVLAGATKSIVTGPANTLVAALVLPANDALIVDVTAATLAKPARIIFIPLTVRTGAGTTDGWFNGIEGFGTILKVPT